MDGENLQVYTGELIGPHGTKVGRWCDYLEVHNRILIQSMEIERLHSAFDRLRRVYNHLKVKSGYDDDCNDYE